MHSVCRFSLMLLVCTPLILVRAAAAQTPAAAAQAPQHPLDPLTAAEIDVAAKVLTAAPQFPAEGQSSRRSS